MKSRVNSFDEIMARRWREDSAKLAKIERLRDAAPDLLAALQSIVNSLSENDDEGLVEHAPQMEAARAAIAKATGEKP